MEGMDKRKGYYSLLSNGKYGRYKLLKRGLFEKVFLGNIVNAVNKECVIKELIVKNKL